MDKNTLKEAILNSGVEKEVSKARRKAFLKGDRSDLTALEGRYGKEVVETARNILYGSYKKRRKIKGKTEAIIKDGNAIFLTLTFKDEVLARTSEKTRRRYVSRFLKEQAHTYVANIDFGRKNEREHYHALVFAPFINYKAWHKYGAIKGEKVRPTDKSADALPRYVAKLSLHAIKETAGKGRRIIYSRRPVECWLFN